MRPRGRQRQCLAQPRATRTGCCRRPSGIARPPPGCRAWASTALFVRRHRLQRRDRWRADRSMATTWVLTAWYQAVPDGADPASGRSRGRPPDRQVGQARGDRLAGLGHLEPVDEMAPVHHVRIRHRPGRRDVHQALREVVGEDRRLLGLGHDHHVAGGKSGPNRPGHRRHVALGVGGVRVGSSDRWRSSRRAGRTRDHDPATGTARRRGRRRRPAAGGPPTTAR